MPIHHIAVEGALQNRSRHNAGSATRARRLRELGAAEPVRSGKAGSATHARRLREPSAAEPFATVMRDVRHLMLNSNLGRVSLGVFDRDFQSDNANLEAGVRVPRCSAILVPGITSS